VLFRDATKTISVPNFRLKGIYRCHCQGIFAVDGAAWQKQRKVSSHLFKLSHFKHGMLEASAPGGDTRLACMGDYLVVLRNDDSHGLRCAYVLLAWL
jgi:hypothetical protein